MTELSKLIRQRADLAHEIRAFFNERDVVEVTTPLLSQAAVTDPAIESFSVASAPNTTRYLRTSPEFPLKRLLSAGAPDLFELGPVFRQGECGRWHNPEFTLLEWYRSGFAMQNLIDEVVLLLTTVGNNKFTSAKVQQARYFDLLAKSLSQNVQTLDATGLEVLARKHGPVPEAHLDRDQWLDFLFSTVVQPGFHPDAIQIVTHYPASQAALARVDPECSSVALRFEVFLGQVELANGFEELNISHEQKARFEVDNKIRAQRGQQSMPIDSRFLEVLDNLPACSGVALGFDRLLMKICDLSSISEALVIDWPNA